MKISKFIHVMSNNEIWDALNKRMILLNEELTDYIRINKYNKNIDNFSKELLELGIVVDENAELKRIQELIATTTDNQFQSLFLITTTTCNLDCDYCFYRSSSSDSLKQRENMTFDVAKKAIDRFNLIVLNNEKNKEYWQQITFYGGEPLINKELLLNAIPYAKAIFNDAYSTLVINTNLLLLDDEIVNLFKDYNVEVQVSLDGNKSQHDLHRKTINGMGSYDIVIKNIKKLLINNVKVLPMITATDTNITNFSDTVFNIVNELDINDYAVNILITKSFETTKLYSTKLAEEMIKAYKKFGEKANDYAFLDIYNMLLGIDVRIAKNSCGSTRKITVFPNGEVFSCQALEKIDINKMGTLDSDFSINPKWELWKRRNKFNNEECLNCEVIASCGGGCATGSYNGTGTIYGIDYNQCNYTKELFKQLVKTRK